MTPVPPVPLVLSAPTARDLRALAESVRAGTVDHDGLRALGRDLATRADPGHPFRAVVLAHDTRDVALPGVEPTPDPGPVAFLFAGQSSQRVGMGTALGREFPEFAAVVTEVGAHADPLLPAPLSAVVAGSGGSLDDCAFAQPALMALGLGLVRLLRTAAITPDVVAGHSFGEYVAAAATGVWSLPDAARVVARRGTLIDGLPPGGGMIAIEAAEREVAAALDGSGAVVSAVHGPSSVAIAGPLDRIGAVAETFAAKGVRTTAVGVANAYHSPAVGPVLAPLAAALAAVPAHPPTVPLVGNATGAVVAPAEVPTPEHWTDHCRLPVRWSAIMDTLRARGVGSYVEVGPSGVLSRLAAQCLPEAERGAVVPALHSEPDEVTAFLGALARLDARGHRVDWPAVFAASVTLRG